MRFKEVEEKREIKLISATARRARPFTNQLFINTGKA